MCSEDSWNSCAKGYRVFHIVMFRWVCLQYFYVEAYMGYADLHIHTIYSPDGTGTVRAVLRRAVEVGLNVIAITDHDEIRAALEGRDLAASYGLQVIPGVEVSTADGHMVALFVDRLPPKGSSAGDTVRWVRDQGGLCFVPHPGNRGRQSMKFGVIHQILDDPELAASLAGIEVFNAGLFHRGNGKHRQTVWPDLPLASLSNSDAHMVHKIGAAMTFFPGTTAQDLRQALCARRTEAAVMQVESGVNFLLRWGLGLALRYTGWVTSNDHPCAPIKLARSWTSAPQTY